MRVLISFITVLLLSLCSMVLWVTGCSFFGRPELSDAVWPYFMVVGSLLFTLSICNLIHLMWVGPAAQRKDRD